MIPNLWQRKIVEVRSPKDSEETPEAFEQMLASLASTKNAPLWQQLLFRKKNPTISLEMATLNQIIHFYLTTPQYIQTFVESQLLAQYPRILLTEAKDYLSTFAKKGKIAYGRLTLGTSYYFPLRTYRDFKDVDPLSTILGIMSKANKGEYYFMQLVLEPAGNMWQSQAQWIVQQGIKDPNTGNIRSHPQARLITQKAEKSGFKVAIRLASAAPTQNQASQLLTSLAGSFGVLSSGEGNQLSLKRPTIFHKGRLWQSILNRSIAVTPRKQYLNVAEIASLWHPPTKTVSGIKNIAWGAKYLGEPPENLPVSIGLTDEDKREINFFARTEFKNKTATFGIKRPDRRRHMYFIGKTGAGKSTLIANMAINDMRNREGLAIIDPHGDLSEILLNYIPSHRINDVVYLDPSDTKHPFCLNPLEVKTDEYRELVASGFVAILYKLYYYSWGPRLEYILRNAIMTLLALPQTTMADIVKLLTDDGWRKQKVLPKLKDPTLKNFWVNEFAKMSEKLKSEAISPILNKVGQFVSSPMIREIIGHPRSTVDLGEVMDKGKILILNLSQGKLGEDNAALLGAMFITRIQLAAMNRVNIPESERKDFYLYVDEFQNFATKSFIKILSEARKYRLNLILANQYIGQVLEDVQKAIFGNAGTLMSFVVGAQDARILTKEYGDVYKESDLVSLDNYQILLKLAVDAKTSPAFFAHTLPLPRSKNNNRDKVIRVSRERYTRKRG